MFGCFLENVFSRKKEKKSFHESFFFHRKDNRANVVCEFSMARVKGREREREGGEGREILKP